MEDTANEYHCLDACDTMNKCNWFTYETEKKNCMLFETCPRHHEECENYVTAEKKYIV